jgi:hypothetical protein
MFIEPKYYLEHVLHPDYFKHSQTCSDADWRQWVRSEKSRLLTFAPLIKLEKYPMEKPNKNIINASAVSMGTNYHIR